MNAHEKITIRSARFDTLLKGIKNWKIAEEDKESMYQFIRDYQLGKVTGNQTKPQSIRSVATYIKTALEFMAKPVKELKPEDTERLSEALLYDKLQRNTSRFNNKVNMVPIKPIGKQKMKNSLRAFLEWKLKDKAEPLTHILKVKVRIKEPTPDYLSEEQVKKMFKACSTAEYRFLIAILFDTGARAEEFHNIRLEDIELPKEGESFVKITLKEEYSKTKGRVISLYWEHSLESVKDFLDERTAQGAKFSEPVFTRSYSSARQFIERLGKKAINRHAHYHLFRHSSATYYASRLNRQQLCIRYGWAFSSNMPDIYISRAGMEDKELDDKMAGTEIEKVKDDFFKKEQDLRMEIEKLKEGYKRVLEINKIKS